MDQLLGKSQTAQQVVDCFVQSSVQNRVSYRIAAKQFEVVSVEAEVHQSRPRMLEIHQNQMMLFLNIAGSSLITSVETSLTRLLHPKTLTLLRSGNFQIREGVGKHSSRLFIIRCLAGSLTAVEVGSKVAQHGERVAKLDGQELQSLVKVLDDSDDYLELANTYYGLLARVFEERSLFDSRKNDMPISLVKLCAAVEAGPSQQWTTALAASFSGYSLYHFSRIFKEHKGCGFHNYLEEVRAYAAATLLLQGVHNPEIVCEKVGLSSRNKLSTVLRGQLGLCFTDFKVASRAA